MRASRAAASNVPGGRVVEVLHPYPENHQDLLHWAKGGAYPLIPYRGRIANGQLTHGGEQLALAAHPDAAPHTLHGTSHQLGWEVVRADSGQVELQLEKEPDSHWPWRYRVQMTVSLQRTSLRIQLSLTNTEDRLMPAGIGLHP